MSETLRWYGVDPAALTADSAAVQLPETHTVGIAGNEDGQVQLPLLDPGFDISKTTYLSRMIQRWGKFPLALFDNLDLQNHRYAFIGSEDWTMYPLIPPNSLIQIDESKRKIMNSGWTSEFDRPIYFFEHRQGYVCGWCSLTDNQLVTTTPSRLDVRSQGLDLPGTDRSDRSSNGCSYAVRSGEATSWSNLSNSMTTSKSVKYNCRSTSRARAGIRFR